MRKFFMLLSLAALAVGVMAQNAFATANTDAVTAVTDATTSSKDTINAAIPLILGVAAVYLVLRIAKKLVAKAG